METQTEKPKRKTQLHPDRLAIGREPLDKLDRWIEQLHKARPEISVTRKDILHWLIEGHPENLSAAEEKELTARFYDEERFVRFALEEIKAARLRGEKLSLEDIIKRKPERQGSGEVPKPRRKKAQTPEEAA